MQFTAFLSRIPWFAPRAEKHAAIPTVASVARRRKVAVAWAVGIAVVAAVIGLPLPAEDALRAVRAMTRTHPVPGDIVVVAIDDATLNALQRPDPSRSDDAKVVDRLFADGAKRVVFDRAFADPTTPKDDAAFAAALKRHQPFVRLGAIPPLGSGNQKRAGLYPTRAILGSTSLASMEGDSHPFNLAFTFPTSTTILGHPTPSISAFLAGYEGPQSWYTLDLSFDIKSVPTVSYADVLAGRVDPRMIAGKSFAIGPTYSDSGDLHSLPFGDKMPGVYLHVIGAHTIRQGLPITLGWWPPLGFVVLVLALQARRRIPDRRLNWLAAAVLLVVPIALDTRIVLEVMPALMALAIGAFKLRAIALKHYAADTQLLQLEALAIDAPAPEQDVFALKIRNYADIAATFSGGQARAALAAVIARLAPSEGISDYAFEKDTIVWLRPRMEYDQLEAHAAGLHALFRTGIPLGRRTLDLAIAIGVDVNNALTLRNRVQTATQCAEDAAAERKPLRIGDAARLAETDWRTQILSELADAMEAGTVGVAYQPKVMLAGGRIVGAEALLRWHHPVRGYIDPEGLVRLAEDRGRINDLTMYVLDRALDEGRRALAIDPAFKLAVNVSVTALMDDQFIQQVGSLLAKHQFPAPNLILEVTESASSDDDKVWARLVALKQLKVMLSIDDFGTGHATFDYLRRIPSAEVKIDRRFVGDMLESAESHAVVSATIQMAHSLDRTVVAEGVETSQVADSLFAMGCNQAQGYLYSPAIPMADLAGMLREGRIQAA